MSTLTVGMEPDTADAWVAIGFGALSGLAVSVAAHALLQMPSIRVRAYTEAVRPKEATEIEFRTFVVVTNLRGRPITIEHVMLLRSGRSHLAPLSWYRQNLPKRLEEGDTLRLQLAADAPLVNDRLVPFATDTAGRIWPRRRRPRVWMHRLRGPMAFVRGRRISERTMKRLERSFDKANRTAEDASRPEGRE